MDNKCFNYFVKQKNYQNSLNVFVTYAKGKYNIFLECDIFFFFKSCFAVPTLDVFNSYHNIYYKLLNSLC